jgi:hypothetical protein
MAKSFRFALAGLLLLPLAARADLLVVPPGSSDAPLVEKPDKGMTMTQVTARYGEPTAKHTPVGGGSKFQPLITRWDYPAFSVVFENTHVIDAVVPDQPPPITPSEELQPALDAIPAP